MFGRSVWMVFIFSVLVNCVVYACRLVAFPRYGRAFMLCHARHSTSGACNIWEHFVDAGLWMLWFRSRRPSSKGISVSENEHSTQEAEALRAKGNSLPMRYQAIFAAVVFTFRLRGCIMWFSTFFGPSPRKQRLTVYRGLQVNNSRNRL